MPETPIVRGSYPCPVCGQNPGEPHVPQAGDTAIVRGPNRPAMTPEPNRPESEL